MADAIRQGKRSPDNTTPTQIRIDKEQLDVLRVVAALENKTISGIVRECISRYISEAAGNDDLLMATIKRKFPTVDLSTSTFHEVLHKELKDDIASGKPYGWKKDE
jgi:predicted DNA-binding protein